MLFGETGGAVDIIIHSHHKGNFYIASYSDQMTTVFRLDSSILGDNTDHHINMIPR